MCLFAIIYFLIYTIISALEDLLKVTDKQNAVFGTTLPYNKGVFALIPYTYIAIYQPLNSYHLLRWYN